MGGGEVLESGSHNDLLLSGGPYATLVAGQQLATAADKKASDDTGTASPDDRDENGMTHVEAQDYAKQEKPELQRTTTGKSSLSSQILREKTTGSSTTGEGVLPYRTIATRFWK
jgi:hypothetical protein